MSIRNAIVILLFPSLLFANTKLEWQLKEKERMEITKTAEVEYLINKKVTNVYSERNIIDLTCLTKDNQKYTVKATFSVYERQSNENVFNKLSETTNSFSIKKNGQYIVPDKQFLPNLRNIPAFPEKGLKEGSTWTSNAEMVINNFSVPFMLTIPVNYTLQKIETVNNVKTAIINYSYTIDYFFDENYPEDFPVKIAGTDEGTINWDIEKKRPLTYANNYHMLFAFMPAVNTLETHEWKMQIKTDHTFYEPEKPETKDIKEELSNEKGVTVEKNEKGIIIRLGEILFDFDDAKIKPETDEVIQNVVSQIKKKYPDREIIVEGHTDNTGNSSYNLDLSKERAKNVADIISGSINHDKVSYLGQGEKKPIANNETKEGRQKNRRVDIIIKLN